MHAVLGLGEERVDTAHRKRPDHGPPEARRAADYQHCERDERQVKVQRLGVQRQQVDVESAGERGQPSREHEGDQTLPVDGNSHRPRCRRILPRGAQEPPEPAVLVRPCNRDRDHCRNGGLEQTGRLRHGRERRHAGPDRLPVAEDVVRDLEDGERRDPGCEPR